MIKIFAVVFAAILVFASCFESQGASHLTKQPSALSRGVRYMSAGSRPFQNPRRVSHPEQSEGSRLGH